jgi:hypothetical protein
MVGRRQSGLVFSDAEKEGEAYGNEPEAAGGKGLCACLRARDVVVHVLGP